MDGSALCTVAVLGASPKPQRFSHQAVARLREHRFRVVPIHPRAAQVAGVPAVASLQDLEGPVDTVTLYLGPARLAPLADDLLALAPRRVIFNPGTASPQVEERLQAAGIECVHGCTLVMLEQGRF